MKRALLALCALVAVGAAAETFERGTAYAYPIGPDFHYFNNDNKRAEMNTCWPTFMMKDGCSFGSAGEAPFGTAAVWFNNPATQPCTVAAADELCPVVADPWNEGAYALKMQAPIWWGFGNFNFALPATSELCRVRAIFRCDVTGASDARKDNPNGIRFRITDDELRYNEEGIPGPNAKVEIPDIWEHPELYRVVDLYTDQLDGNAFFAISFLVSGFSCGGEQPAFYLEEVSIVPTKLLAGDNHVAGEQVVTAVAERPELTVIDGEGTDVVDKNKLVAGTVDAPNYYVFKTGRGTPYLAYSAESLTTANGIDTHLHRTGELTEANIWAVTPGDAEGTLHITAYGTNLGLMDFVNADGASYHIDAVATVSNPQDIYPVYNDNGTVSLCLNNSTGRGDDGNEFYTLDASLRSDFLGNWRPGDDGTNWTTFQLDMTDGVDAALAAVERANAIHAAKALIAQYTEHLNAYKENVPWVADELIAGIEALRNFEFDNNYEKITEIYDEAISKANAVLATYFDSQTVAFKNICRVSYDMTPYLGINNLETPEQYYAVESFSNVTADFTLKSVGDGGYTVYNKATKTWLSPDCIPTTDETAAQVLYLRLQSHWNWDYAGIALAQSTEEYCLGLNLDRWGTSIVSYQSISDDGSIWSIVMADDEAKAKEAIAVNVAKLEPYVPAMPEMVANILTNAIDEIKALKYSETIGEEAATIVDNAISAANELLATGLNGMNLSLKNLRQNQFISIADGEWIYDINNQTYMTAFQFKAQPNGGYILYNEGADIYVGENIPGEGSNHTDVPAVADKDSASVLYPFLCKGGSYYGVALAIEENPTGATWALNTNNDPKIFHTYPAGDPGSIFALVPFIDVPVATVKLHGVVGKVGDSVEVSAVVEPENASDQTLNWSSSNPEVAAVDADGVVWFNAAGNVTVTAECQGYEISVPFVVREVIARALNVFPVEAVGGVGHQFSLLALHEPENTTDKSVTWESSDPEVATVSEDGRVSLASLGTAQITARSGEHTAVCSVTVNDIVGLTEMASTGVVIDIVEGGIIVRNAPVGEMIAVYAVDGKAVNGAFVESDETRLNLAAGIYIVKVSPSTVAKVLVK